MNQDWKKEIESNKLLADAFKLYESELDKQDNADYFIVKDQMKNVIHAYKFFDKITKQNNGKVERFEIIPKEINAGITAYGNLFYFDSDEIHELTNILNHASALSIDATSNGTVCISFTIPNVYQHK